MEQKYQFHYDTQANSSYLVAVLPGGAGLVDYQVKMLENNSITNLLDVRTYQQDGEVHVCYNVTSRLALSQVFTRQKMQKEEFITLLSGLVDCCRELPEYQLPARGILMDEDYIFVKTGSFEPRFVFLPIYTEESGIDGLCRFVQKMILDSRIASTRDDFVQRMLELVNTPGLTLEQLEQSLKAMRPAASKPSKPQPVVQPVIQPKLPEFEPPVQPASPAPSAPSVPERKDVPKPKGKNKHGAAQKQPSKEKKSGSSKSSILFIALQGIIVLVMALAVKSGFLMSEDGSLNISYLFGLLIAAAGIDFVVYRELFVNKKEKKPQKKGKKQTQKAEKKIRSTDKPAEAEPAKKEYVPVAAPVAPPLSQADYPVPAYIPVPSAAEQEEDFDTVILDNEPGEGLDAHLEYFENGLAVRIHLTREVTRVGSWKQAADHVLNSRKVSKAHAEFVRSGGQYFVRDLNSTNGTYLNGDPQRIVSNQNILLHDGDRVRLADIELVFKC